EPQDLPALTVPRGLPGRREPLALRERAVLPDLQERLVPQAGFAPPGLRAPPVQREAAGPLGLVGGPGGPAELAARDRRRHSSLPAAVSASSLAIRSCARPSPRRRFIM